MARVSREDFINIRKKAGRGCPQRSIKPLSELDGHEWAEVGRGLDDLGKDSGKTGDTKESGEKCLH